MTLDSFMKLVSQSRALLDPEHKQVLIDLVKEYVDLEQVLAWINDVRVEENSERLDKLVSLMEIHPLGFEKYVLYDDQVLGNRARLHYWPQNKWPFESIHDHRFNFCATVLCGHYIHEEYSVISSNGDSVDLKLTNKTIINTGDVYYFTAGNFHRVLPSEELTLSLILRGTAVLPFSRVIDPEKKVMYKALGAKSKFLANLQKIESDIRSKNT
ncbi:hypothetical protein [Paenibacillus glucanolyticus]|uniref:hypothetical protein n=1 Tax=Paenibacillus glucanolyticus TaxID=59843 RepID=UPI0034CF8674